jgi:hypothetical protein
MHALPVRIEVTAVLAFESMQSGAPDMPERLLAAPRCALPEISTVVHRARAIGKAHVSVRLHSHYLLDISRGDLTLVAVEYRFLNDLGQVRLTSTSVHDDPLQARMVQERARFERRGIVLIQGETSRVFTRTERIDSHVVETKLRIQPAVGGGYRGARCL